jgi:cation:H+ antiporter
MDFGYEFIGNHHKFLPVCCCNCCSVIAAFAALCLGVVGLWASAKIAVRDSKKLIKVLGIPSFLFGSVFMSVSTGLPEIATAVISAFEGVPELSAGDLAGSSFINLSLILGGSVVYGGGLKLSGEDLDLIRDAGFGTVFAAAVLGLTGSLSLVSVSVLLAVYGLFLYRAEHSSLEQEEESGSPSAKTVVSVLVGVAGLLLSARAVVFGAESLGRAFGVPVEILGATVVAVGTGLPEFAFEAASIRKGETSLALGDLFGSTLVNITLTMSVLGFLSSPDISSLLPVFAGVGSVGLVSIAFSFKGDFSKVEGLVLIGIAAVYLVLQVFL